jgi:hypothetical protein
MAGKIFGWLISLFWLTTMLALVRMEFFPPPVVSVPAEEVVRRILSFPESQSFKVFYRNADIGEARFEVNPLPAPGLSPSDPLAALTAGHRLVTDLNLDLRAVQVPMRVRMDLSLDMDENHRVDGFRIRGGTTRPRDLAGGRPGDGNYVFRLEGSTSSRRAALSFIAGGVVMIDRVLDLDRLPEELAQELRATPELGAAADIGRLLTATGRPAGIESSLRDSTTVALSQINIEGVVQPAYVITGKLDETLWVRLWVSKAGELLHLDSAPGIGLTVKNSAFTEAAAFRVDPAGKRRLSLRP